MNDSNKNIRRRDFFISAGRLGLLGLAGIFSAGYLGKRQRFLREGKCIGGGKCSGCYALNDCSLPVALKEKGVENNGRK